MSEREYKLFISDIRDCARKILQYTRGKSYEEFLGNQLLIPYPSNRTQIFADTR